MIKRTDKRLLGQYLLVFAVFFLMVIIAAFFAIDIVAKNLSSYGKELISASAETLEAYLKGYQATFEDVVYGIEMMYAEGAGADEIAHALFEWNEKSGSAFIYGVVDGQFIHNSPDMPIDYDYRARPWFNGAVDNMGQVYFSDRNNVTLSKVLHDSNGIPCGVLAFDVLVNEMTTHVNNIQLMGRGYGVLVDSDLRFIVHADETYFGLRMDELQPVRAAAIREQGDLNAFRYASGIMFSRKLFNDWHLMIEAPYNDYYSDVYIMVLLLSLTGLAATAVICIVLTASAGKAQTNTEEKPESEAEPQAEEKAVSTDGDFLNALDGIDEIDKDTGLENSAGFIDIYKEMIETFCADIMPETEKMTGAIDGGDLKAFEISVHGVKAMCSTIGAMKLFEAALALENSAKKEDTDFCVKNYPNLNEGVVKLHKKLSAII